MFERVRQTKIESYRGTGDGGHQQRVTRSVRRALERADAERVSALKWQWRCACESTPLAVFVYTASGVTKAVPQIADVELGPPVALTIRVREGQSPADYVAAAPSLARALNVATLEVIEISPRWLLRIVLRPAPRLAVVEQLDHDRERVVGVRGVAASI